MFLPRLTYNNDLIISKRENIAYLTGLKQVHPVNREALLFITKSHAVLYHSLFLNPPKISWLETIPMSAANPLESVLPLVFSNIKYPGSKISFEAHNLTYAEYQRIQAALPQTNLIPTTDLIENIRLIKDSAEVKAIQKACAITTKTMSWILKAIHSGSDQEHQRLGSPGVELTELELSRIIEQKLYDLGADSLAFPIIVAFDQHSALPHHLPDKTKLMPNSIVLLDFGCVVDGYASDMSRTICLSTPSPDIQKIETLVKSAYTAGLNLLRQHYQVLELTAAPTPNLKSKIQNLRSSPITASQLDESVRSVIKKAGYGDKFTHTSGHGLGLEIHEQPSLNSKNTLELKPGMVITLEPGIYLEGKFGCRHENTLLLQ